MPQENNSNINNVHLEGAVFSCEITSTKKDSVEAMLSLCTAKQIKGKERIEYSNPMKHRVFVSASGEKAQRLIKIVEDAAKLKAQYGNEIPLSLRDIVAIDGKLAVNAKEQPFVLVKEQISFPKKLTMKNSISLQGRVMETTSNVAYASAKLAIVNPVNKETEFSIPVCIYSGDNPKKWADLSQGKVKQGEMLSVKGPLISKTYSAGDKTQFVCSVNISNYDVLSIKQTRTKKTQHGVQ